MNLIDILRKRASDDKFEKEICRSLCSKADEIIEKSSAHLKYVRNVLDEFDMYNAKHSEEVLKIIESLLGDDAEKLSSYDLFSLIAVAYLHDCGMAVSDAEINVMKLVENEEFVGKKVCTAEEAKNIIECNKDNIFKTERDAEEIKNWLFYPGSEQKLYEYYAVLLRDYQTFRNGKIDVIYKSKDHNQTNKELRLEYIRRTHADRAEIYINTWEETDFSRINTNKWAGILLFRNIAKACKAHGVDVSYIKGLEIRAHYSGWETFNVQFVAMMLRISVLAHFDYQRAPIVLRALHQFESDYSHEQWRIKTDSVIEFWCEPRQIHCQGFCKRPKDYYDLTAYIDYIDKELALYNKLKYWGKWGEQYPSMTEQVEMNGLQWDKDFIPVPNLKFTLEQNRILELLMGAELYSDEYACLREIYQNSLDACRCQIAKDKSKGKNSKGEIEFGLKSDEYGEKYVYCLDNGKGMSKHIIENYLLKIGSSYYKSPEFYQSQAESGNTFTPTSQFGIGIMSCFMIGDRVEITTREDGKEYISCVMENIHECFYYKATPQKDKDVIPSSGTLIKIFLKSKYQERMSNEYLEHIGYLLWENEQEYDEDKRIHLDHLYFILDSFVKVVPENITLNVRLSGEKLIKIENKPQPMGTGICAFPQNDDNKWNIERIEKIEFKELDVEHEGIRYRSYLVLPTEKDSSYTRHFGNFLLGKNAYCVDGIKVDDNFVDGDFLKVTNHYRLGGVLNFIGADRPQLSVSRENIVKYNPDKYERKIKDLLSKLIKQAIDRTASYIKEKNVKHDSTLYEGIWKAFFERFEDIPVNIVAQHLTGESIQDLVMPWPKIFTSSQMTFGEFLGNGEIKAVITGDIVRSEQIALDKRDLLLKILHDIVEQLQKLSPIKMEFFRGDSFQIIVERPEVSLTIVAMIRAGLKSYSPTDAKGIWDARISLGIGTTDYQRDSIVTSDGEAFKLSGRGLDAMQKNRLAVSTRWDDVNEELDGSLAFADDLITRWSVSQAKVIYLSIGQGLLQADIANRIGTSQQNVSKTLTSAKELLLVRFLNRCTTIIKNHITNHVEL